jgi:arsenite-transporting ATPase
MLQEAVDTATSGTRPDTKFLWFSGKGGTGKTSISAATALQLADRGHDVLLISTDPAHSLSDALDIDIDGKAAVNDRVDALELDPEEEVDAFQEKLQMSEFQDDMGMMDDVYESMDIMKSGPGVTEMAAFNKFIQFMHSDEYDVIVFDTAPTGHTLSLLELPDVMDSMVGKVLRMRMRFSDAIDTFKSFFGQDSEEEHPGVQELEALKKRIESARELMTDPTVTTFNFVMLAEKMSVYETERAVDHVNEFDIPIDRLFVNQLIPKNKDCDFCTSRRTMQQDNLELIHDMFDDYEIVEIPMLHHEVRGEEMLHTLADNMTIAQPGAQ